MTEPLRTPTPRWAQITIAMALLIAAVALLTRSYDRGVVPMDEGHLASAAVRVMDGDVLYRDIHTGVGPGVYHFAAALFAVFGEDLRVLRSAQVAVNCAICLCLFALALRIAQPHWAALAPLLYLLWVAVGFPVLTMLNYSSLALAGALAALLVAQRYAERGLRGDAVVLGCLLAATALTKQNYGALAIVAVFVSLLWNRRGSALATRSPVATLAPVAAGGIALTLAVVGYFALRGGLPDLVRSTLLDLGGSQLESFDNPIPPIFGAHPRDDPRFLFLYSPPTLFHFVLHGGRWLGEPVSGALQGLAIRLSYGLPIAALIAGPVLLWRSDSWFDARERRELRAIVVFALLFFLGIFPSAIWSHLAFVVAPCLLVAVIGFDRVERVGSSHWRPAGPLLRGAAVVAALACVAVSLRLGAAVQGWYPEAIDLPRAGLYATPRYADLFRRSARFVEGCAAPDEAIFVAPDIPIVYFLSGRRNPTPYDLTIPGKVDGDAIVERLERDATRCVVYNPQMYPEFPPFASLYPELDRYLRRHYRWAPILRGEEASWQALVRSETAGP